MWGKFGALDGLDGSRIARRAGGGGQHVTDSVSGHWPGYLPVPPIPAITAITPIPGILEGNLGLDQDSLFLFSTFIKSKKRKRRKNRIE